MTIWVCPADRSSFQSASGDWIGCCDNSEWDNYVNKKNRMIACEFGYLSRTPIDYAVSHPNEFRRDTVSRKIDCGGQVVVYFGFSKNIGEAGT
jgi:hypothetical protein